MKDPLFPKRVLEASHLTFYGGSGCCHGNYRIDMIYFEMCGVLSRLIRSEEHEKENKMK
jgi:hypothetical protein